MGVEIVDDFFGDVADGAHRDDNAVGVGSAVVVEELIVGAELGVDLVHILLDDFGKRVIVLVAGLTVLEEGVAVFVGAAHVRMLGVERVLTEGFDGLHVAHIGKILIVPNGDLLDLVGGAEAVEEVDERDSAGNCGKVSHGTEIHDFLHVALAEHGKTGLAAGHDVGVIAEDVQRVGGDGTGGDMEDAGQLLGRDLVHVGDHQKKTLGCGIGGGQGARAEGAVNGTGSTGFRLHFNDLDLGAENVFQTVGGPLVDKVGHGGRRRDRVDRGNFTERIAHMRGSGVAIHGLHFSYHK